MEVKEAITKKFEVTFSEEEGIRIANKIMAIDWNSTGDANLMSKLHKLFKYGMAINYDE